MARTKQREVYGNGSVSPEKRNGQVVKDCWRVCITLGTEKYVDKEGRQRKRQRKVQKTVRGSLADARKVCKQMVDSYEHVDTSSAKKTFADAVSAWSDSMRENETCAPSKLRDYETRLSYVSAHLGSKLMVDITTDDLEKALSAVKAERKQSQRTYRDTKRHVKRVFKFALSRHWIVFDPSEGLAVVSVKKKVERRSLEADDFARLRACIDRDIETAVKDFEEKELRQISLGNGFTRSSVKGLANISCLVGMRVLCSTGCRRGEALALTWGKLDFATNSMTIDRSLNADAVLKEPKTEAGVRTIAIDGDTMAFLARWKTFQKKALHLVMAEDAEGKARPVAQSDDTPIVCSCVGSFLNPHNMNRWWNEYRESIGFPTLKLHELRHTAATLLLGNHVPVVDVAARLGHDDVAVTLNYYAHAIPAHDQMAANLIGSLMTAPATTPTPIVELKRKTA